MAITKQGGRQWSLHAKLPFNFADLAGESGNALGAVDLPGGASVIAASMTIDEVFNSATSDTLAVSGAGITLGGVDGTALGTSNASALDETTLTALTEVTLQWTGVGAVPTTGNGFVHIEYIQDGKADAVQPV